MTFKIDLQPAVDFFSGIFNFVTGLSSWQYYILGSCILSLFLVSPQLKSLGSVLTAPLWVPFYILARFLFPSKKVENIRQNTQEVLESQEVIEDNTTHILQKVEELLNLMKNKPDSLTDLAAKVNNGLTDLANKVNHAAICYKNELIGINNKLNVVPKDLSQKAVMDLNKLVTPKVSLDPVSPKETMDKQFNAVADLFKGMHEATYVSFGVIDKNKFYYKGGVRLAALRSGKITPQDMWIAANDMEFVRNQVPVKKTFDEYKF